MAGTAPKVSVCVVCYNQEKYIAQCLQSIVDQKTDFPFEVLVSDDCSKDGSPGIVEDFARRYPEIIRPILNKTNLGPFKNYALVHGKATGQYVAHMDGDDYALEGKLQAQVDFLDRHPEVNIVWHRMRYCFEPGNELKTDFIRASLLPRDGFSRRELIALGAVGLHSSKMYRAACNRGLVLPDKFLDQHLDVEHVGTGKAHILPELFGVYRVGIGIATRGESTREILLEIIERQLKKYPAYRQSVHARLSVLLLSAVKNFRKVSGRLLRLWLSTLDVAAWLWVCRNSRMIRTFRIL